MANERAVIGASPGSNVRQIRPSLLPLGDQGRFTPALILVPFCPHEGCGWSMPDLWCPDHGNFGMTFLFAQRGALTHVKAHLS